uniref:HEAT repeat domain-containing protein n=1 Tax=Trichloromonas sp. TaxID=3069249 RepID=UPI003D817752
RKQFLNSAFRSLASRSDLVEEILSNLQHETLLDLFTQVENHQVVVPQAIMTLLGQMARKRNGDDHQRDVAAVRKVSTGEIQDRLKVLFRENADDNFVPAAYQESLKWVATTMSGALPQSRQIEDLKGSLATHFVEEQVCSVILEVIDMIDPDEEQASSMRRNLMDLLVYFLETGDYRALAQAHQRLLGFDQESPPFTLPIAYEALLFFSSPAFVAEVMAGLDLWGKDKHDEIGGLIRQVGAPFVEPLLDRLAEEPSLAMRRFCMACLGDLREVARKAILGRLHDRRWYVVRNLVVLLRQSDDPAVLTAIGALVGRSHPKVHLEVMKTYLHFKDPRADRYLVKELEHPDVERKLNAVRLCGASQCPEVVRDLTRILDLKGKSEDVFELKGAAIKALAEIGNPAALPAIEDVINARSLWAPALFNRLKAEAVGSLVHYRDGRAKELLRRLAGGKGDLARLAETALSRIEERGQ